MSASAESSQRGSRENLKRRARSRASDKSSSPQPSPSSPVMDRGRSLVRRPSNSHSDDNFRRRGYHALVSSFGKIFHVERRWKLIREMGSGAYGYVISAKDDLSGETVAIKLVSRVFEKVQLAKRALREITLLRHFANHENITGLIDVDAISQDFQEIYIFMEPMEADLHQIVKSGQSLTNEHVQYFLYQILRGMKYVHSADVIHRDLKPGNLLVNADCELKICDFGLSRGFDSRPDENATNLTEYVATRWYRAPEIMLAFRRYDTAIDVWSIGCILAELLMGRPIFKGKDYVDQLNKILDVLGTPEDEVISRIGSDKAQAYIRSLPVRKKVPLRRVIPTADMQALDLLSKMLTFDPAVRITVAEALEHPWLATYHDVNDEPVCAAKFEKWRYLEQLETLDEYREALWNEIEDYRMEIRGVKAASSSPVRGRTPLERRVSTSAHRHEREQVPAIVKKEAEEDPTTTIDSGVALGDSSSTTTGRYDGISKSRNSADTRENINASATLEPEKPGVRSVPSTDPVIQYARRASMFGPTRQNSSHSPFAGFHGLPAASSDNPFFADTAPGGVNQIAFPSSQPGFVVPARSRTVSMAGEEVTRKLLRTLSTVSIHESVEGLPQLQQYLVDRAGADAPASEMPRDFGINEADEESSGEKKEGRFIID